VRGAVDVGTNTVRLLTGRAAGGQVVPESYFRRITRLGGDFRESRLAPAAMERTLAALAEIASLLRTTGISQVRCVGTAVLRAAANGPAFVARVRGETGLRLEIIDGEEEARLGALGVLSALEPRSAACLIVDLGGGSTEFVLWREKPLLHRSYPLGVVRLAEDFPDTAGQEACVAGVLAQLREDLEAEGLWAEAVAADCRLVGTAGTVTTLAALHLRLATYDWRRINNLVLTAGDLERLRHLLEPLPVAAREGLPGMEKGRGDLILPGLRIVQSVLALFGRQALTVSDFGLLEGILLDLEGNGSASATLIPDRP
jgi:exopolyphosphatase/guanosine-5'-triphosphate,3'-diphosphate pyrophosphatase